MFGVRGACGIPVQSCVCKFTASVREDVYPTVWVGPRCTHLGILKYHGNTVCT